MKLSEKLSKGLFGAALTMLLLWSLPVFAFANPILVSDSYSSYGVILLSAAVVIAAVAAVVLIVVIYKKKKK